MLRGQGNGARGGMRAKRGGGKWLGGKWAVESQHGSGVDGSSPQCMEGHQPKLAIHYGHTCI